MSEYGYCEMRSTINGPEIVRADKRVLVHDDLLRSTAGTWSPHTLDGNVLTLCPGAGAPVQYEVVAWDAGSGAHVAVRIDAPKQRVRAAAASK